MLKNNILTGLAPDLLENGVDILEYADDTVLCIEHHFDKAINLKLLIYMFALMSRLKINFQNSEILCVGGDENILKSVCIAFCLQNWSFPHEIFGGFLLAIPL